MTPVAAEKESSIKITPSGVASFTCTTSKIEGTLSGASGAPLPASFTTFSFDSCSRGAEVCEVKTKGLPYSGSFKANGAAVGLTRIQGAKFEMWCGAEAHCTYTRDFIFKLKGGAPAKIARDPADLSGSAGCPIAATMEGVGTTNNDLEYKFTAPGSPAKMWPLWD
jgi:hypothetical protein